MAAFGFSVGDFIAVIVLVKDLISALQEGAGAKSRYRRLITELVSLEHALTEVQTLKVDDSLFSKKFALEQIASQCLGTIDDFLKESTKFSATLGTRSKVSKWNWRANLHKIQWALFKDDAVDKLGSKIMGHTLTINTLLATIQL